MLSIGEFSKVTGLTVKTLRFYHDQGILVPSRVEPGSGYRFYSPTKVETARVIAALRELEFSIAEIAEILTQHDDDSDIVAFLESRKSALQTRMRNDRRMVKLLESIILHEKEAKSKMTSTGYQVERKSVDSMIVASIRMRGKYSDSGKGFGKIGRKFGRFICGTPLMLCHDSEYREDDADFEVAMPIKKGESTDEITVQELPGGTCLSLMHLGPYEELSRSYEQIIKYAQEQGVEYTIPSRELYHKGPGMIFRGNPKKYLTEIQLMLKDPPAES